MFTYLQCKQALAMVLVKSFGIQSARALSNINKIPMFVFKEIHT